MDEDIAKGCGAIVGFIIWLAFIIGMIFNTITIDKALARAADRVDLVSLSEIQVVRHSNNWWFIGHPGHVTLELMVNGKPYNEDCWSSSFSPMVCTVTPSTFSP